MPLTVIVVGAGITGLTAALALHSKGFHVTVLERNHGIPEIGGPISIRPAAMRCLRSLGLSKTLDENHEPAISTWHTKRYDTGETLYEVDWTDPSSNVFGDESVGFARQALQKVLFEETVKRKIEVKFSTKIVGVVDDEAPVVTLEGGEVVKADLVVGADGINSIIRESMLPPDPQRINSIQSCWMLKIPLSIVKNDPEISKYLTRAYYWLGPGRMAIATILSRVDVFDLHLYIDKELCEPSESEKVGNMDDILKHFQDFDPVIFKIKSLAPSTECYIWRISKLARLPTWISKSGRIVIIGDAAHAMVPNVAQGASQGIEDAVVLAECLSRADNDANGQLGKVLQVFERVRKPRVEAIADYASANHKIHHASDGPVQQARDKRLRAWKENALKAQKWNGVQILEPPAVGSPLVEPYMFGYDALAHVSSERVVQG
ncbi:hypothetical protein BKA63DRAFT_401456 [Paraphoma chrysanthemicola]|nr:hypothetical protein BKA63DRAFT_401456 [Paraphoma chrysanthemicola]